MPFQDTEVAVNLMQERDVRLKAAERSFADVFAAFEESQHKDTKHMNAESARIDRDRATYMADWGRRWEKAKAEHEEPARVTFLRLVKTRQISISASLNSKGKYVLVGSKPDSDESGIYPESYYVEGAEIKGLTNPVLERFELTSVGNGDQTIVGMKYAPREDFRENPEASLSKPERKELEEHRRRILDFDIDLEINKREDGSYRLFTDDLNYYTKLIERRIYQIHFYTHSDVILIHQGEIESSKLVTYFPRVFLGTQSLLNGSFLRRFGIAIGEKPTREKVIQGFISSGGQALVTGLVFHFFGNDAHALSAGVATFAFAFPFAVFSDSYDRLRRIPRTYFGEIGIQVALGYPLILLKSTIASPLGIGVLGQPMTWVTNLGISLIDKIGSTITSIIPRQRKKYGLNEGKYFGAVDKTFAQREGISAWPRTALADLAIILTSGSEQAKGLGKVLQAAYVLPMIFVDWLHQKNMEQRFPNRRADLLEDRRKLEMFTRPRILGFKPRDTFSCTDGVRAIESAKLVSPPSEK
jgi:hypothetical protein